MAEMKTPEVLAAVSQSSKAEDKAGAEGKLAHEIDRQICAW